jgi:hypothetical protein
MFAALQGHDAFALIVHASRFEISNHELHFEVYEYDFNI